MQSAYNTQVMEKNDTRYDTFDFNVQFRKRTGILISETKYFLNKSKSKWISVGFSLERKYEVVIKLGGIKNNQHVIFNEDQWISFLNNQGIMLSFVYSNKTGWQPMHGNGFQIHFVYMGDARIIKISQDGGNEVFLAGETISELSNLVNLVKYRYDMLKFQEFSKYYNILVSGVSSKSGDLMNNLYEIISPSKNPNSANICCMLELLNFYSDCIIEDVESFACNEFVNSCFGK
ncbi:unnamed protein product [Ceutorhynchus assimilis]|uniref:Uncharacterized protein n=1 Tax=Ceutorhynchus assimilis TaxID=467358 RepID=A0A9N9MTN6_9CUCU|nr:unnamed protein product [Ceutorhynchus assimilis]